MRISSTVVRSGYLSCAIMLLALPASTARAQAAWTDWTAFAVGTPGTATGSLILGSANVTVTYAGEVVGAQTSCGTNYWTGNGTAPATYGAPTLPAIPPCDIVRLIGGNQITNTISFSAPVTNPFIGILSLGQLGVPVTYAFNAPFVIVSSGQGYFGNGTLTALGASVLEGREGHGAIQFAGTFTSISWTVPNGENWHGFTVGAEGIASVSNVPEPSTLALVGLGLAGAAVVRRRRTATADRIG